MAVLIADWLDLDSLSPTQITGATLFSLAVFAFDVWAITRALARGHGVQGTLSWIFAILAFPGVGAAAFFLLASPSVRRVALRKRRTAAQVRALHGRIDARRGGECENADSLVDLATAVTGLPPTAGNQVHLLTDEGPTFERIEAAMQAAKRFIWTEYYIIRNDLTGRRFLTLLLEKALAKVEVRLLYDAIGSMGINTDLLREIVAAGGIVQAFQPMNPLRRRLSFHLRNHRKVIVVDGEVGFTGGMNMGDEYSSHRKKRKGAPRTFRDAQLELRGPAVAQLAQTFAEDWAFGSGETLAKVEVAAPAQTPGAMVSIVASGPDQEFNASGMVHFAGIASARRRVHLTSPYFIPDDATVTALVSAALRRVDVRVLLPAPAKSDMKLAALAARSYYAKLLRGGVRLFEYEPAMLHSKTFAVDGLLAFVGSANLDIRSFRLNFEVGAIVSDPAFVNELEQRFVRDLAHSREITLEELARVRKWKKTLWLLARLLSPVL